MATPAHKMISQKRTVSEQNTLNRRMLDAILNHRHTDLEAALREGANPHAVGVTWPNDPEPSIDPPLITAIYEENFEAIKLLIAEGADVSAHNHKGVPGIVMAVDNGHYDMVELLLSKKANLIDAGGINNLLYRAICCLGSYGVLLNATGEDPATEKKIGILCSYHEELVPRESLPKEPVVLDYKGNVELVKLLLRLAPEKITDKVEDGFSALDVVQKPTNYSREFWDCDGIKTIRCLPFEANHPKRLSFELTLDVRGGDHDTRFKAILRYDLSELCRLLEARAPDQALAANVANHEMRLGSVEQRQELHFAAPEEQARFEAWLKRSGNDNLKIFHDGIKIPLENIILGFKVASTDLVKTNLKDQQLDALKTVLGGLATLVNTAPLLGAPVAVGIITFKKVTDKVSGIRQRNVATYVAHFGDIKKTQEVCASFARKLTQAYAQQLLALEYPRAAEDKQGALQRKLQEKKKDFLKAPFVGPAEQAAKFAMLWIVDQLYEADKIAEAVKERGLDTVLFSHLIQQEPPKKLKEFWVAEVIAKALGSGLLTRQGIALKPQDFFTLPGIRVLEGDSPKFYTHSRSNPSIHGWRFVSRDDFAHMSGFRQLPPAKAPVIENDCWFSEGVSSGPDRSNSGDYSTGNSNGSSGSQGKQPQASVPITLAYNASRSSNLSPIGLPPMPIMPIFPVSEVQQPAQKQKNRR